MDFLTFCVEHHTFHIKNYILNKDLLKRILVLLKSKHQFVALTALKFLRKTIGLKEDIYNRYIIKQNLFEPVVEALCSTASRYNILNSAIIELFDFIRTDDIKSLMVYVVENFSEKLESITYVKTFRDLKTRYEQHKEKLNELSRTRLNSSETTPSISRTRYDRYHDRLEFDKDEDAWIEEDDDELKENKSDSVNFQINSSSSSNSNDETNENNFESYLEMKKSKNINLDENEDTLFSPAKSVSPPTSPSSPMSRKTTTKSISIKISSTSVKTIMEKSEEVKIENAASPNSQRKHVLVDYEDDSEDEEMSDSGENGEPLAKRPATESNSILNKTNDEDKNLVDTSKKEENKENEVVSDANSPKDTDTDDKNVNNEDGEERSEEANVTENETSEINGKFPNINNVNGIMNGSKEEENEDEYPNVDETNQAPLSPIIAEQPAHKRARLSNS